MRRRSKDKKKDKKDDAGLGTRGVWAGEQGKYWERATQIPVALSVSFGEISLPRLAFDAASAPVERAYAVLEYLDRIGDKIVSGIAHFA